MKVTVVTRKRAEILSTIRKAYAKRIRHSAFSERIFRLRWTHRPQQLQPTKTKKGTQS